MIHRYFDHVMIIENLLVIFIKIIVFIFIIIIISIIIINLNYALMGGIKGLSGNAYLIHVFYQLT